jgi:glycosyltransferase involved in cell wall biosynthesis
LSYVDPEAKWVPGSAPVAVIMISLNEAHNMDEVCRNLKGWAQEVYLVDSYSRDGTVDIALSHGVKVVQRKFNGFGEQWAFALDALPIAAPWTMKLDPDERVSQELKLEIERVIRTGTADGIEVANRLWFMGRPLPRSQRLFQTRLWRTGHCRFSGVLVNEHPMVAGAVVRCGGELEHHDSPHLEHWYHKQNRYTTDEAIIRFTRQQLAAPPRLFGTRLERRMWLKKNFFRLPLRYAALFVYLYLVQGAWKGGRTALLWAQLRIEVMRMVERKEVEMRIRGRVSARTVVGAGRPDPRVPQF